MKTKILSRENTGQSEHLLFQLKQAVDIMQLGLTISDLEGTIIYANQADAEMHGYRKDELIGQNVGIYAPPELRKPPTMEQLKQWKGLIRESVNVRKDSTQFPVWLMSEVVKSEEGEPCAIVTSCEDITERKRAAEALHRQTRLLHGVAEAMNCLLVNLDFDAAVAQALEKLGLVTEVDRVYIFENHREPDSDRVLMSQRFEWVSDAILSQIGNPDLHNVPYELACPRWYALLSQNIPIGGAVREFPLNERNVLEAQDICSILVVPIMIRGEFWGFIGFDSCRHEREWREEEEAILLAVAGSIGGAIARRQAEEDLRNQREAKILAEAASEAKSEFLATMSHELRTPLNGVLGYTQLLRTDPSLTEHQRHMIGIIHRSAEHLLMMINEILDLSKIEARQMLLEPGDFTLSEMLTTIVDMTRIRAEQKGIEFNFQIERSLPVGVYGDEKRLRQILLNLLGNAIKFTDQGNVTFRVRKVEQKQLNSNNMKSEDDNGQLPIVNLQFSIEDTGPGIDPQHLEHIFSAFYQVRDTHRTNEGAGLGLAISQQLIRMMGGELQVNSTVGVGSRFWFEIALPTSQREGVEKDAVLSHRRIIGFNAPVPYTILIADDNRTNRDLLKELLQPLGFNILEAENGAETIHIARTSSPDLLLLDLVMPVFDGVEVTRQLRQFSDVQNMIILAISASVSAKRQQECLDAGCQAFLPKPFSIQTLLDLLQTYLPLEWQYSSEEDEQQESVDILPSPQELQDLYQLALGGQLTRIRKQLRELQTKHPKITPFSQTVCQYIQEFQIRKIQDYIREAMEVSHE